MLARVCIKQKDWQCASNAADALIKADAKRSYPEIYLHRAVARYGLKDLTGAEESAQEAVRLIPNIRSRGRSMFLGGYSKPRAMPTARVSIWQNISSSNRRELMWMQSRGTCKG